MRAFLAAVSVALIPGGGLAQSKEIRWPDADIRIPQEVAAFIAAECRASRGGSAEDVAACIDGESFGYRAVVTILMDARQGEQAAARYRACRVGLGVEGGRFHRRRAECIGGSLGIVWRFAFTRKASASVPKPEVDFAGAPGPAPTEF